MLTIELPPGRSDVLVLNGDLDAHTAHRLQCILHTKLKERHPTFYLDCTGLRFIDSRGIAVMIEYTRDAKSFRGQLVVLNPAGVVAEVLKIAKLEEHFHCRQGGLPAVKPAGFVEPGAGI